MLSLLFLSVLFAFSSVGIAQHMNIGDVKRAFTAAASSAASTAASGNIADAQSSLTLDPNVIATGFENNGLDVPTAGQVASLTSSNNFINFCLTVPNLPITNGKQITTGSCNPAPMGSIPSTANMPSAKFTVPANGDTIPANTAFTITMAVANFDTGNFVNAEENFLAAPQQLNAQGQIIGHSQVVVESLTALDQTTPTDPRVFAFFKGLNDPAVNGVLTADVPAGLPAGFYKASSINTAANFQPVLVPVVQHGSLDDVSYFTVSDSGAAANPTVAKRAPGPARVAQPAQKRRALGIAQDMNIEDVKRAFTAAHIPETINLPFDPKVLLQVTFPQTNGAKPIMLQAGDHLQRNETLIPPIFHVKGSRSKGPFVIAEVDPDVPTPQDPTVAQVRHFLGGNFYLQSDKRPTLLSNNTPAISHYREPNPRAGSDAHRYIFLLFDQPSGFDELSAKLVPNDDEASIIHWNVSAFAAAAGLGPPIGGTFMFVAPDPTT